MQNKSKNVFLAFIFKFIKMKIKQNLYLQFIIYYVCIVVYSVVIPSLLFDIIGCSDVYDENTNTSFVEDFIEEIITSVFGSIIETIIFSFLVLKILNSFSYFQKNINLSIIISAIPFAMGHFLCFGYILATFFVGIVFNYYYLTIKRHYNDESKAIVYISLLHFMINFTVFIINKILLS